MHCDYEGGEGEKVVNLLLRRNKEGRCTINQSITCMRVGGGVREMDLCGLLTTGLRHDLGVVSEL